MFLDFVIVLIKAGVVLFALLNLGALLTWAERKQSAFMQDRIGPNRANVGNITAGGLLHILLVLAVIAVVYQLITGRSAG